MEHMLSVVIIEGLSIYYDGELMGETNSGAEAMFTYPSGSGQMVIGRTYSDSDEKYVTMEIDELTLRNN